MTKIKRIALVAHDNRKADMVEWVEWNWKKLIKYDLICTGTTGKLVNETLLKKMGDEQDETISMKRLKSGPLGGDQQLGALISEGKVDMLIFLWDPMTPQPHDVDVKALLRLATLYNIPTAVNRSTADFMISSMLMDTNYKPIRKDYGSYINRKIEIK
ncbi:MAG: methylglyoxal synthase [Bacteroidales bacterium]|jgi:methylglyoxal synthase|nr:methylglyoxal synthase [Bacteroidales bacterium]